MDTKKMWKKIGFGILFVAACFITMYVLMEYHEEVIIVAVAAVFLLAAAFLFLNEIFMDKAAKWAPKEEEASKEPVSVAGDGEFRLKITKYMKEMENSQKELISVLKNQNTILQSQIENLEHEIYMLSEKQANHTKSVIKFNKENARQLAISERETLEYIMLELKKAIEDNAGGMPSGEAAKEEPEIFPDFAVQPEPMPVPQDSLEEVSMEEVIPVTDLPGDEEFVMPEIPAVEEASSEETEIPEIPEDIDLSELFDIPELFDEPTLEPQTEEPVLTEPAEESIPVAEAAAPVAEEKTQDLLSGLGGDPNAMMTPEDIAKLLEAMGQ